MLHFLFSETALFFFFPIFQLKTEFQHCKNTFDVLRFISMCLITEILRKSIVLKCAVSASFVSLQTYRSPLIEMIDPHVSLIFCRLLKLGQVDFMTTTRRQRSGIFSIIHGLKKRLVSDQQ